MKEFEIVLDKRLKVVNFIPVSGLSPGDLAAGSEFPKAISPLGKRTGLYLLRWSVGHDQRSFEGPLDLVLNHEEAHYLVKGTKENGHIHLRGKEITSHLDSPIETLKRRASFFEALTRSFADGLIFLLPDGTISELSVPVPALFDLRTNHGVLYSRDGLLGRSLSDFLSIDEASDLAYFIDNARTNRASQLHRTWKINGKVLDMKGHPLYLNGELQYIFLSASDKTEQEKLQSQVNEAQEFMSKAASLVTLGEVSAGIAHEINTPLASIEYSTQILKRKAETIKPEQIMTVAGRISETTTLIAGIIKNLLNMARPDQHMAFESVGVQDLVLQAHTLVKHLIMRHEVKFMLKLADLGEIDCRSVQLQQVLVNLMKNAVDAIKDQKEPWLEIRGGVLGDNQIYIEVCDSGPGLPADIKKKILEPFFTTKDKDSGTGLGLSISTSIIRAHGGILEIREDIPNTCFRIVLPRSQAESLAA